jgi:hypothetical protein
MSQAELTTKQQVFITEVKRTSLEFSLEEVQLPTGGITPLTVFHTDNVDNLLPKGSMLNVLCNLLMPKGEKVLIDHVIIKQRRNRLQIGIQLSALLEREIAARGRVDAALRTCHFEPTFSN